MCADARAATEDPIKKVLDAQVIAWNKKDLETFMSGYWKSEQLTFFSGGTLTRGWQQTLLRYQQRYQGEGKEMGTLSFEQIAIESLGPKSAVARGIWHLQLAEGKEVKGLFTLILRKLPEGWRIIHDHTSI